MKVSAKRMAHPCAIHRREAKLQRNIVVVEDAIDSSAADAVDQELSYVCCCGAHRSIFTNAQDSTSLLRIERAAYVVARRSNLQMSRRNKTDSPATGTDASPDRLHRKPFAEALAEALLLPKASPSFVISLEGKFGFGKTSLIRMICETFDARPAGERPIVFHFNPWVLSDGKNLVQDFLFQFATAFAISDHGKNLQKAANELVRYSSLFSMAKWIPGAEPWASIAEKAFNLTGKAAQKIGELKALNVEECRIKVAEAIAATNRPVVVFIDDLDRLPPADVFAMIRLVKAVSDFDRVSFLLSYDHEYVTKALAKCDVPEPARYLEKIVQWRRSLPRILPSDLFDLLNEQLRELNAGALEKRFPKDTERISEMYFEAIRPLLKNPREIHRVFNGLHFVVPATKGNVVLSDLLGLEVLAVKAPGIYDHIRHMPASYTRDTVMDFLHDEVGDKKTADGINERNARLAELPSDERSHIADLLLRLFPRSDGDREYSNQPSRSDGLVACTEVLNIYLSVDVPCGEISLPDVEDFVRNPGSRPVFAATLTTREKIRSFFEIAEEMCRTEVPVDLEGFFLQLCEVSEGSFAAGWLNDGLLKSEVISFLKPIILNQLRRLERSKRAVLLRRVCANPRMLPITQPVIYVLLAENGVVPTESSIPPEKHLLTATAKKEILSVWKHTAAANFKTDAGWTSNARRRVFWLLWKIAPKTGHALALKQFKTDLRFDQLLRTLLSHASDSKGEIAKISVKDLEPFGGIARYKRRGKARLGSPIDVPQDIRVIIRSIETGKAYYLKDGADAFM